MSSPVTRSRGFNLIDVLMIVSIVATLSAVMEAKRDVCAAPATMVLPSTDDGDILVRLARYFDNGPEHLASCARKQGPH